MTYSLEYLNSKDWDIIELDWNLDSLFLQSWYEQVHEQYNHLYFSWRKEEYLKEKYNPNGFNVGINSGEYAGQTVFHMHIHLIPRYKNDVENPRGGVRNVIPGKGDY